MLVQSLLWFCQGKLLHVSCVQTAGSLPAVLMKSCCLKDLHTSTCGPRRLYCSWYWLGSDSGLFFDVFLAFWRFGDLAIWRVGVLACWRSGSGGAEKLCAVDVKKTCSKGGDARYSKCAEIAFFEDKNRKRTGETTKGRAYEPINVWYLHYS